MVACDITTAGLPRWVGLGPRKGRAWGPYRALGPAYAAGHWLGVDPVGHPVRLSQATPTQAVAWRRLHRMMSRLAHPNLAHIRDLVEEPGQRPVLVESLRQEGCPLPGRWPAGALARLGAQLAMGLAALHQAGWAHGAVAWDQVRVGPQGEAWWVPSPRLQRFEQGGEANRDLRALGRLLLRLGAGDEDGAVAALCRRLIGPNPIGAAECAIALGGLSQAPPPPALPPGGFRPPLGWSSWVALEAAPGWRAWTGPRGVGLSRLVAEAFHQLRRAQVMAIPLQPEAGAAAGALVAQAAAWLADWGRGPLPKKAQAALAPQVQEDPSAARAGLLALVARLKGPVALLVEHWEQADAWSLEVLRPGEGSLGHAHVMLTGEEGPQGLSGWPLARWGQESLVAWVEEVNGAPLLPGQGEALAQAAEGLPGRLAKGLVRVRAGGQRMASRRTWLALAAAARRRARAGEPLKALAAAEGALAALMAIDAPPEALRRAGTLAADLARRAGHGNRAAKAYRAILRQADLSPGQAADLCISLARAELLEGRQLMARKALDQALQRLSKYGPTRAKEARARVHLALARLLPTVDPLAASHHATLAHRLSSEAGMRAIAKAHAAHSLIYAHGASALPALEAAVLACMRAQDPDAGHTARMLLGDGLMHTGRLVDARPCFASNLARGRATGDPSEAAYASINLALVAETTHEPELFGQAVAGAEGGAELGDLLLEELGSELVATAQRRRGPALPASAAVAWRTPTARAYAKLARAEALVGLGLAGQALPFAQEAEGDPASLGIWSTRARLAIVECLGLLERREEAQAFLGNWVVPESPAEQALRAFAEALVVKEAGPAGLWARAHRLAEVAGLKGLSVRARLREVGQALLSGSRPSDWAEALEGALAQAEALGDPALVAPLAAGLAAAKPGGEAAKLSDMAEEMALQAWGLDPGPRDHPERRALLEAGGQARVADLARRLALSEGKVASTDRVRQALAAQLESSGHDLRGPLGSIRAGLQALRQGLFGPINEEQDEAMAELSAAAIGLERRVDAMLDAARLEAGALTVQRLRLDWARLLGEPLDLLQPFAKQRGVRLQRPTEGELAALPTAYGDARRLAAAVQNLLHNALKFTPAGGCVALEVGFDQAWVHLRVLDEGPGLPVERRAKPFARYGHTQGGSGLGLWLAHEVVRLHGGQLTVGAREEAGTCFALQLPQVLRKAQARSEAQGPQVRG